MKGFGIIGLLVALCVGYFVVQRSATSVPEGSPQKQIDVTDIRMALLSAAKAEQQYQASHGNYGTIDELQQAGLLIGGTERRGYTLSAEAGGATRFTITAVPTDADKAGWPTLEITERMEVVEK